MVRPETVRYAYRICPCFSYDIEGIQSWLEDMSAKGLVLEADGIFAGIFTFQKTTPQLHRYRLAPVKQKKGFFSDSSDAPEEEEQEFSAQCGWEYILRYGSFYIYRATDPSAVPLHTDPVVQALAIENIKKQQRNLFLSELVWLLLWFGLGKFRSPALFMTAVITGPLHLFSFLSLLIWVIMSILAFLLRLTRYQKRLRAGDPLESRKDWRPTAPAVYCAKAIPWILALTLAVTWGISLKAAGESVSLAEFTKTVPFATLEDVFPEAELDRGPGFGDYNTVVHYRNALAENYEWNENADITGSDITEYGILRLKYHITPADWIAKGLADDYYHKEATRYHGKRFEDLEVPETALDNVRVFSSYGIVHVLIQHRNIVVDAVVQIQISDLEFGHNWELWLTAMEEKLLS
jgi:hypothetical protein